MSDIKLGYNYLDCGEGEYLVLTPERRRYRVSLKDETCTCPAFAFHPSHPCKHLRLVRDEADRVRRAEFDARIEREIAMYY